MLYLLLTGQLPFAGEDMAVLQKLVNEPHPPLSTWLASYPPALDGIIDRALAKDPEQRYLEFTREPTSQGHHTAMPPPPKTSPQIFMR